MLNPVWPLSRLVEVLWGQLPPPFLPSPLPCPGRGMRDLEGLSTERPLGSEAAPEGKKLSSCLTPWSFSSRPCASKNCFLSVLPACMYHGLSATVKHLNNFSCDDEMLHPCCLSGHSAAMYEKWWHRCFFFLTDTYRKMKIFHILIVSAAPQMSYNFFCTTFSLQWL